MSAPVCSWAFKMAGQLKLSAAERLLLWAIAERVNPQRDGGRLLCWSGYTQLVADTALSRRTLPGAAQSLQERQLIRIEKHGQKHVYVLLAPVQMGTGAGAKGNRSADRQTGANGNRNRGNPAPANWGKIDMSLVQMGTATGANGIPESSNKPLKEPVRGVAAAQRREPVREVFQGTEKQEVGTPPPAPVEVPPKAPTIGATPGGGGGYRPPGGPDPFADDGGDSVAWLDQLRAKRAAVGLAVADAGTVSAELAEPEAPVDPKAVAGLVRSMGRELRHFALAGQTVPDRWQQLEQLAAQPVRPVRGPVDPVLTPEQQIAALLADATPDQLLRAKRYAERGV